MVSLPEFKVIPPGLDVEKFYPYYHDFIDGSEREESSRFASASVQEELNRFLKNPDKPLILALCRADKRKNITGPDPSLWRGQRSSVNRKSGNIRRAAQRSFQSYRQRTRCTHRDASSNGQLQSIRQDGYSQKYKFRIRSAGALPDCRPQARCIYQPGAYRAVRADPYRGRLIGVAALPQPMTVVRRI